MNHSEYHVHIHLIVTSINYTNNEFLIVSEKPDDFKLPSEQLGYQNIEDAIKTLTEGVTEIDPAWTVPQLVDIGERGPGTIDIYYKITIPHDTELLYGNHWVSQSKTKNNQMVMEAIRRT